MRKFILLLLSSLLIISNIAFNTFVLSAEDNQDTTQENQGVEEPADETQEDLNYEVGTLSVSNNEYEVVVILDESNKIPEGTVLSVHEIKEYSRDYNTYVENAAAKVLQKGDTLPYARFFDISFVSNTGEIIEPEGSVNVQIDLKDDVLSTEDVTFQAVHFIEENNNIETEVLDIETDEVVSFETESFSTYGVIYFYTVDFYYNDKEYHMNGGSEMYLSELFEKLGIDRDVTDVDNVEFTDYSLVEIEKADDDWLLNSLEPFTSHELLTITFNDGTTITIEVEDATQDNRTPNTDSNINWNLSTDGTLTIRPTNNAASAGFTPNRTSQANWDSFWKHKDGVAGGASIRTEVKKVIIKPNDNDVPININNKDIAYMFSGFTNLESVEIQEGAFSGSPRNIASMFRGCTKLNDIQGLEYLDTTNVQDMSSMFRQTGSETSGFDLDLSAWKNNEKLGNMQYMFQDSGLTSIILNNENFKTRPYDQNGTQLLNMFGGCNKLVSVDMSNITLNGRPSDTTNKTGHTANQEAMNLFANRTNLETVIMNNTKFVDMASFNGMFSNCPKLTTVEMTSDTPGDMAPDAVDMRNMFKNSFINPNSSETATLDVSGLGKLEHIVNMDGFIEGCSGLEVLNIDNLDNSRIEPVRGNHPASNYDDGAKALNVNWGRMLLGVTDDSPSIGNTIDDTLPALTKISAKNTKVWMVRDNTRGTPGKEYYTSANDTDMYYFTELKWDYASDAGEYVTINTKRDFVDLLTDRYEAPEDSSTPDASTNINRTGGKDLNSDETNNGDGERAGFLAPGVYTLQGDPWDVPTIEMEKTFYRIDSIDESTPDVVVNNSDLEDNGTNRIDTVLKSKQEWGNSEYIIENDDETPVVTLTYLDAATDINGNKHDVVVKINKITFNNLSSIPENPNRLHDPNSYVVDEYKRPVIGYSEGKLTFNNMVWDANNKKLLSSNSGTYIDFTIEIADAKPDTSVLFYMEDLDVSASQEWISGKDPLDGEDDWHWDNLPYDNNTYGPGSEGMILGDGNDLDTLKFADHTGLERRDNDSGELDENGNYIVPTGSDPTTAWSSFSVRADATGSKYTWTSGISCDTNLLRQTPPPDEMKPVFVIPEALKRVNDAIPAGDYAKYFDFVFEPDSSIAIVDYEGNDKAHELVNSASGDSQIKQNNGEKIAFTELEFDPPKGTGQKAYIYKVTEQEGSDTDLEYDTETTYYMQIVVSDPENDLEMYLGTKAEIITGKQVNDGEIMWNTHQVITVYASDAEKTEYVGPNGETVFKDNQGILFYSDDGEYYKYPDGSSLTPDRHAQVDYEITYNDKQYKVMIDHNDVEYFIDDNGDYRDPNDPERSLIPSREGDIDPAMTDDDSPVADYKRSSTGYKLKEDVHGIQYYKVGSDYYDEDNNQLTLEDGVFNPDEDFDKDVIIDKTVNGNTVYKHVNGLEYYSVEEGGETKYYAPDGTPLDVKTDGDVDPLPSDKVVQTNEIKTTVLKETVTGNSYTVKEDKHGKQYYYNEVTGRYYSVHGILREVTPGVFEPSDTDKEVTVDIEIWLDSSDTRFYKHYGKYFQEADDSAYTLSDGTIDTSEIVAIGTFHNRSKTSEITVIKTTVDDKSGKFKVHVEFDSDFEPTYVVYEPASKATFQQVSKSPNIWEFEIENGQRMSIMEVPFNTTYTITEPVIENGFELVSIDGDDIKSVSNTITTQKDEGDDYNKDYEHTLENRFTEVILKKVVEQGDKNKDFEFTPEFTISGLDLNEEITVSYGTMDENDNHVFKVETVKANSVGDATITMDTIKLRDGKDIVIVVPRDSQLKITEDLDGYEVSITGADLEDEEEGIAILQSSITDKAHVLYTNRNEGPTVDNVETSDLVDRVQTAKFNIRKGNTDIVSKQLIDPDTGEPTDASEVDALDDKGEKVGTYKYDPETDTITFTPNSGYYGTPKPGRIIVTDESGLTATGEYTPTVIPVVPPKPPTPPYVPPKTGV